MYIRMSKIIAILEIQPSPLFFKINQQPTPVPCVCSNLARTYCMLFFLRLIQFKDVLFLFSLSWIHCCPGQSIMDVVSNALWMHGSLFFAVEKPLRLAKHRQKRCMTNRLLTICKVFGIIVFIHHKAVHPFSSHILNGGEGFFYFFLLVCP